MNQPFQEPIEIDEELAELERLSDAVLDQLETGCLEDAERTCSELKRRFPGEIDWLQGTALLQAFRGEREEAVRYYRRSLDRKLVDAMQSGGDVEMTPEDWVEIRAAARRNLKERLRSK